jgi:hypothetical protein
MKASVESTPRTERIAAADELKMHAEGPRGVMLARGRWSRCALSGRREEGSVMKVTFGALPGGLWKIPQMFVVSPVFNHYPLLAVGAMRLVSYPLLRFTTPSRDATAHA